MATPSRRNCLANAGATLDGLEQFLGMTFDIAETQLDTNPTAIEIRRLEALGRTMS